MIYLYECEFLHLNFAFSCILHIFCTNNSHFAVVCVINNECDISPPKVGWMKAEDQTILTLHNKIVTHNSRISVTHDNYRTWQLHIRQVKESDRGCYMCQINTSVMKKQVVCVDVHGKYSTSFRALSSSWRC
jgi:hypothetical protein